KIHAPGEVLVDVVHCVDYGTLYSLTFVNSQFHNVAVRNAGKLARRRDFALRFTETALHLVVDDSIQLPSIVLDGSAASSLLGALTEVASIVGLHAMTKLCVDHGDWLRLPITEMFAVLPALEHVIVLRLRYAPPHGMPPSADYVDNFITKFPHAKHLNLGLFRPFDWTYLRRDSAVKLHGLQIHVLCESQLSEEEVLRYCTDTIRLPGNELCYFRMCSSFSAHRFRQEEVERVVEVLSESQSNATMELPTGAHLHLPERNFLATELKGDAKKKTLFTSRRANVAVCVMREGYAAIFNVPEDFLPLSSSLIDCFL
ncbi:hypothetical protein AAVH_36848, partial [Aphelenchoides avenae]